VYDVDIGMFRGTNQKPVAQKGRKMVRHPVMIFFRGGG